LKSLIQSVELRYFVHATEDPEKVRSAVASLVGVATNPETELLEGHFGNEIMKVTVHLTGEDAQRAFGRIASQMSRDMKRRVVEGMAEFLDEHSALFLRLDKQDLVSGKVSLGAGDAVRVKVKPRMYLVKGEARELYSQLMGGG